MTFFSFLQAKINEYSFPAGARKGAKKCLILKKVVNHGATIEGTDLPV